MLVTIKVILERPIASLSVIWTWNYISHFVDLHRKPYKNLYWSVFTSSFNSAYISYLRYIVLSFLSDN